MDEEKKYWVGFNVFPGIGPLRFRLLLKYFGSARAAWHAKPETLKKIKLGDKLTDQFDHFRKKIYNSDKYLKKLSKIHVAVLTLKDAKYPKLLKEISDAPFVLYVKAKKLDKPLNLERTIAVVGTRKVTPYGRDVTERLTRDLVAYGFTIISGMAYGVDAAAHESALESGGKTIAVLGCGIDIIAPPSNASLYHRIGSDGGGAVLSEMPLGLRPNKGVFPARNRIISGLSLGVLVTEGADDSGALITARNAGEQGREVFAVPGPITSPYSKGPSKLIKNGAKLVESAEDIIEELGLIKVTPTRLPARQVRRGDTKEEQKIIDLLKSGQRHIDEIVRFSGLTIQSAAATLTVLEMKGIVKDVGDKIYALA